MVQHRIALSIHLSFWCINFGYRLVRVLLVGAAQVPARTPTAIADSAGIEVNGPFRQTMEALPVKERASTIPSSDGIALAFLTTRARGNGSM